MVAERLRNHIKYILIMAFCVSLDQVTKWLVLNHIKDTDGLVIVPSVFRLQYHENTGAAFGMLQNQSDFFVFIKIIILILIGYFFIKIPIEKKYAPLKIVLTLIASGAIGNLIDRIAHGHVIDFLYFEWIDFPIFNVADSFVTISAVLLFLLIMFRYKDDDFHFLRRKNGKDTKRGGR